MMRSSKRRNIYSNRRRRKGRKSLYTRFRCDPDPWNGSPPKTPPSSDDEAAAPSASASASASAASDAMAASEYGMRHDSTMLYAETVAPAPLVNRNGTHHRNRNRNRSHNNYGSNGRDRLNEVKRKLSNYVKMENANVLQCHQFTRQQTKLNARKTAPVPLPLSLKSQQMKSSNKNKIGKSSVKQLKQLKQLKQATKVNSKQKAAKPKQKQKPKQKPKPKQKQKQTAPAPKPPLYVLQQKQKLKSNSKAANLSSSSKSVEIICDEFQMRAFADPFIPRHPSQPQLPRDACACAESEHKSLSSTALESSASASGSASMSSGSNDELIDFASIPEAYYVGYDNTIVYQSNKENVSQLQKSKATVNNNNNNNNNNNASGNWYDHTYTPQSNATTTCSDEVGVYSPISTITANSNSNYQHFVMSDFTNSNSDCSTIIPPHNAANNLKETNINIVLKEINTEYDDVEIINMDRDENEEEQQQIGDDEMMYFNDDKFALLAEQILEEEPISLLNEENINHNLNELTVTPFQQNNHHLYNNNCNNMWGTKTHLNNHNIWAEPPPHAHDSYGRAVINGSIDNNCNHRQTLGGLLMHGLPPISTQLFH